ncbi:hypothetical protein EJ05DRAFT_476895 [Pseudovirgaria hyperparasitica]|uniref:DNA replication checkpoint mediator MRC1 domain-containing protein n=1 Tax=Pseudovirgaria hyperparasitica TaxID=470096 RepID=A0A6A6W6L5_9PEZI|nr:uncharacterized protein EJ05DRAFT_476895 [Pseudovirgaria hyperparasitica]KAF2757674.1 hypothetical protein EJ05DRAFT_476895 [Pseudovirgaria hyperparasitica]
MSASDSDSGPIRPRGRTATRMQSESRDTSRSRSAASRDPAADAAYEAYMKKMNMGDNSDNESVASRKSASTESSPPKQRSPPSASRDGSPTSPLRQSPIVSKSPDVQTSPTREPSPGLFVSSRETSRVRAPSARVSPVDSDSDLPTGKLATDEEFQRKVAEKRAERLSREESARNQKEQRRRKLNALSSKARKQRVEEDDTDSSPDEAEQAADSRLTQETTRPNARKAGRKALEEMSREIRENQRFNRSLQLTHQAKTKKKITKDDLFKTFNFRQTKAPAQLPVKASSDEIIGPVSSDAEMANASDTPPTSPATLNNTQEDNKAQKDYVMSGALGVTHHTDIMSVPSNLDDSDGGNLPDLNELLTKAETVDKGKARAITPGLPELSRTVQVHRAGIRPSATHESDDDLEILPAKASRFPVFDNLPAKQKKESRSMLTLRALAHLTSPGRTRGRNARPSVNVTEMQSNLIRRGRQQARAALMEKIEEAKANGTYVDPEELKKAQEERANELDKLRQDVEALGKKERADAKKNGEVDESQMLPSDDEDDADFRDSDEDAGDDGDDEEEIELSGSEDEVSDEDQETERHAIFDEETGENATDDESVTNGKGLPEPASDDDMPAPGRAHTTSRKRHIIEDDEDDDSDDLPIVASRAPPDQTQSTPKKDIVAAFGFDKIASSPALGLTQMFAGTMAEPSQPENGDQPGDTAPIPSLDFLRGLGMSSAPDFDTAMADDSQNLVVPNSQIGVSQQEVSQVPHEFTTPGGNGLGISQFPDVTEETQSQFSDLPDPTQDAGFQVRTPAGMRDMPSSTTETVLLPTQETPVPKQRKRLQKRSEALPDLSDIDEDEVVPDVGSDTEDDFELNADVFKVMKNASKKKAAKDAFNKKKSEAKTMFEEQADESEDEYAGLGGASDDDSGEEMDEETAKMIDHGKVDEREREIAALHAERERDEDEKNVQKLHKDIINGGLRRKRAANDDLLGAADDDFDALDEMRRKKQADFRRSYNALMKNEKLQKLSGDKTQAFLRAVQDMDDDPDYDFYISHPAEDEVPDSQEPMEQDAAPVGLATKEVSASPSEDKENRNPLNPLKRPSEPIHAIRPPPALRRTNAPRPAPFLAQTDIRASLSSILDDPDTLDRIPDSQLDGHSDSDAESDSEPRGPASLSRQSSNASIVDRLSLSRAVTDVAGNSDTHFAFHAPAKPGSITGSGFKVPSLVRRATSNFSNMSTSNSRSNSVSSSGASTPVEAPTVRMGGSKKSNIHFQAREAERKKVLDKAEERRRGELRRKAREYGGRGGLGGVLGGKAGWD